MTSHLSDSSFLDLSFLEKNYLNNKLAPCCDMPLLTSEKSWIHHCKFRNYNVKLSLLTMYTDESNPNSTPILQHPGGLFISQFKGNIASRCVPEGLVHTELRRCHYYVFKCSHSNQPAEKTQSLSFGVNKTLCPVRHSGLHNFPLDRFLCAPPPGFTQYKLNDVLHNLALTCTRIWSRIRMLHRCTPWG